MKTLCKYEVAIAVVVVVETVAAAIVMIMVVILIIIITGVMATIQVADYIIETRLR